MIIGMIIPDGNSGVERRGDAEGDWVGLDDGFVVEDEVGVGLEDEVEVGFEVTGGVGVGLDEEVFARATIVALLQATLTLALAPY